MSIDNVIKNRDALLITGGKNAMNVKFPDEFELYLCALELVDESNKTLRYFVFPVMPSSMDEGKNKITNIKKTLAGVTTLSTPTFVPTDISLSGNFGRSFKVLLGGDYVDFISSFQDNGSGKGAQKGVTQLFDDRVKTGYGCVKILESILDESDQVGENGELRKLILHNPSTGNSYIVKCMNFKINMNEQTNMIWNYSVNFKSIAPLKSLYTTKELESKSMKLNLTGFMQTKTNNLLNTVSSFIAKTNL